MKKLILLSGRPASGKSTAFKTLKKHKKLNNWIIVDHPLIKKEYGKEEGKIKLNEALKEAMKTGKNILTEETSRKSLNKYLSYHLRKYNYEIIVFQFTVGLETAIKREAERRIKVGKKPHGAEWVREMHEMHDKRGHRKAYFIDTTNLSKKEVINFIFRKLGLK